MPTPKGKKFTVSEFQTWLDGIMEFQEDGWSPSPEQWNAIYQKIQNLKEPPKSPRTVTVDEDSIEDIVSEVSESLPDFGNLDFELLNNVLNAIFNQMRQGATMAPNHHTPSPQNDQSGVNTHDLQPPVSAPGDELANIPLSQLREQQGQLPSGSRPRQPQEGILEDVEDEFV